MASGTISKRSTSTSPRSVSFSDGITDSARKASVRKGVAPLQPRPAAASLHARLCATPFLTLAFLALSVIPSLKLTDRGLVDVDRFEIVPLAAGEPARLSRS